MAEEREYKTKDYVRRAQNNYRAKFDQVALKLPKGSKDIIREKTGKSVTTYINELVARDLKETYGVDISE
jgi:hypothetical protein